MGILDRLLAKPSVATFAQQMIQAFREAGDNNDLRFDAAENCIVRSDPDVPWTVNLANMYQAYLQTPRSERAEYVRSTARSILIPTKGLPDEFELARADLRPRLWLRAVFEQLRLKSMTESPSVAPKLPPWEGIGEHLVATLAYDWPQSVQVINDDDVAKWGVSFYEAMEVARENLQESTVAYAKIGDGLYSFVSGDSYDASRITLVHRAEGLEVKGSLVAMVPNRDLLLITGSEDEAGLAIMAAMAEKGLEQPYSLSAVPLIWEDDDWKDWMPPHDHPLHRTFKQMKIKWLCPLYHEQKELLVAVHKNLGIDIFVASYSAIKKQDGDRLTFCAWSKGADSLLPVAQRIAFIKGEGIPPVFADWQRVMETFGDLMEPTDEYPRRYRVREFPDESTIDAIGSTELS
jgi:hypothetical protein